MHVFVSVIDSVYSVCARLCAVAFACRFYLCVCLHWAVAASCHSLQLRPLVPKPPHSGSRRIALGAGIPFNDERIARDQAALKR